PDLILASDSYTIDEDYDLLSKIAPTLSYQTGVGSDDWQTQIAQIAPLLGRSERAGRLVTTVEQQITEARKRNPEFEGKTFTGGPVLPDGTVYTINSADDAAAKMYAQLGLQLSPKV
ncbi:MAG: ABC transporter substrate-binding protein, partial [Pseudonocardiaceae bacterium]